MTIEQQTKRVERGVILAATLRPKKIGSTWVVNGWMTDVDTCACPDFEFQGGQCKHQIRAQVWESRENVRSVA
jgi:SWIM zinc finger